MTYKCKSREQLLLDQVKNLQSELATVKNALRLNKAYYDSLTEDHPLPICRFLPDTTITYVNSTFADYLGKNPSAILGKKLLKFIPRQYPLDLINQLASLSLNRSTISHAETMMVFNNRHYQIKWTIKAIFNDNAKIIEYQAIGQNPCLLKETDITGKTLQMPNSLQELEMRVRERTQQLNSANLFLQQLIDTIPIPVFYKNLHGVYLLFNKAWEEAIGISKEEALGSTAYDCFPKHLADLYDKADKELIKKQELQVYEGIIINADGFERNVVFNKAAFMGEDGRPEGLIGVYTDITDHKKIEKDLRESEQRIADIINFLPDAIVVIDKSGKVIYWNIAAENMTGVKAEDVIGKGDYECGLIIYGIRRPILIDLVLDDNNKYEQTYDHFECNRSILWGENFCPGVKGTGAYLRGAASRLYDTKGNLVGAIESFRDITERKQYEEALQASEEMYRQIVETANEGIWITDAQNITTFVNKRMAEMLGYSAEDLIGRPFLEFMDARTVEKAKKNIIERRTGRDGKYDTKYLHKDGHFVYTINSVKVNYDKFGNYIGELGMVTDITKRRKMEKQMARLDRLNLVGEIAAGIAHEIRNPMTSVRGFLQILQQGNEYQKDQEFFNIMIEELDRANYIITEFLSLGTNKLLKLKLCNLNKIINAVFPLIKAETINQDKNISLQCNEIPDLLLDEMEIRQLILNLVNNGLEAMQPGKTLAIYTFFDEKEIVLAIHDQGCGIHSDILDKIGTSFHTIKENGTGLGLAMCYSIAARHNATIDIDTSSAGTTVFVRFLIPADSLPIDV